MAKLSTDKKMFIGAFVVIATGGYLVYKYMKKSTNQVSPTDTTVSSPSFSKATTGESSNSIKSGLGSAGFPLKKGSKGIEVQILQKYLNEKNYANPKLTTDGAFGALTEESVKKMQYDMINKSNWVGNLAKNKQLQFGEVRQDFYEIIVTQTRKTTTTALNNIWKFAFGR